METGLTSFNGARLSLVAVCGEMAVRKIHVNVHTREQPLVTHVRAQWRCEGQRRVCVRARGRESLENASASNHRASNRTRRGGARQPADTIVTGCINPPSWYPQGRASNPEVNALDSHRSPSASSSASSLTSFSEPFPSLSLFPFCPSSTTYTHTSCSLVVSLSRFRRATAHRVSLALARG